MCPKVRSGSAHLHADAPGLGLLAALLVLHVLDGDHRYHDLLKHGAAVHEACAASEVEAVGPFGDPELHPALGAGSLGCGAVPRGVVVGETAPQQVALLGDHCAAGLVAQISMPS